MKVLNLQRDWPFLMKLLGKEIQSSKHINQSKHSKNFKASGKSTDSFTSLILKGGFWLS